MKYIIYGIYGFILGLSTSLIAQQPAYVALTKTISLESSTYGMLTLHKGEIFEEIKADSLGKYVTFGGDTIFIEMGNFNNINFNTQDTNIAQKADSIFKHNFSEKKLNYVKKLIIDHDTLYTFNVGEVRKIINTKDTINIYNLNADSPILYFVERDSAQQSIKKFSMPFRLAIPNTISIFYTAADTKKLKVVDMRSKPKEQVIEKIDSPKIEKPTPITSPPLLDVNSILRFIGLVVILLVIVWFWFKRNTKQATQYRNYIKLLNMPFITNKKSNDMKRTKAKKQPKHQSYKQNNGTRSNSKTVRELITEKINELKNFFYQEAGKSQQDIAAIKQGIDDIKETLSKQSGRKSKTTTKTSQVTQFENHEVFVSTWRDLLGKLDNMETVFEDFNAQYQSDDQLFPLLSMIHGKYSREKVKYLKRLSKWEIFFAALENQQTIPDEFGRRMAHKTVEQKHAAMRTFLLNNVLADYISTTLIFLEELKNLEVFAGMDTIATKDAQVSFGNSLEQVLEELEQLNIGVNYFALFSPLSSVNSEKYKTIGRERLYPILYKTLSFNQKVVLEIKKYGVKDLNIVSDKAVTKVILSTTN